MPIRVEFYGIARRRAGVACIDIEAKTLGEAFERIAVARPGLAEVCTTDGCLKPGFLANINGQTFTSQAAQPLSDGDTVLVLSADVGG